MMRNQCEHGELARVCVRCELEQENAKLREELDTALNERDDAREKCSYWKDRHRDEEQTSAEWKQRAELAEAKIREAEGQEPVAYIYPAAYGSRASLCKENKPEQWDDGEREWYEKPLYARPTPPADVAELERHVVEKSRKIGEMQRHIAELERKLAEYQSIFPDTDGHFELNAILAKARAGAVPQWVSAKDKLHPDKPGLQSYEQIPCLIVRRNEILLRQWNCEHLVWDDEDGDDFYCEAEDVTYWMPLPAAPKPEGTND